MVAKAPVDGPGVPHFQPPPTIRRSERPRPSDKAHCVGRTDIDDVTQRPIHLLRHNRAACEENHSIVSLLGGLSGATSSMSMSPYGVTCKKIRSRSMKNNAVSRLCLGRLKARLPDAVARMCCGADKAHAPPPFKRSRFPPPPQRRRCVRRLPHR